MIKPAEDIGETLTEHLPEELLMPRCVTAAGRLPILLPTLILPKTWSPGSREAGRGAE